MEKSDHHVSSLRRKGNNKVKQIYLFFFFSFVHSVMSLLQVYELIEKKIETGYNAWDVLIDKYYNGIQKDIYSLIVLIVR